MAKEKDPTVTVETPEAEESPLTPPKPTVSASEAAAAHEERDAAKERGWKRSTDDDWRPLVIPDEDNHTPAGHFRFGEGPYGSINLFGLLAAIFATINPLVAFVLGIAGIYVAVKAGRDFIGWVLSSFAVVVGAISLGKLLFLLGVFFSTQPMPMW